MSPSEVVQVSSFVALVVLGVAMLLSVVRVVVGPTLADRILALDLMSVVAMGFVGAVAIRTGLSLYLDVALVLALLGFLATLGLVRYMLLRQGDAP